MPGLRIQSLFIRSLLQTQVMPPHCFLKPCTETETKVRVLRVEYAKNGMTRVIVNRLNSHTLYMTQMSVKRKTKLLCKIFLQTIIKAAILTGNFWCLILMKKEYSAA